MADPLTIARQHRELQVSLAQRVAAELDALWQQVDRGGITRSWAAVRSRALILLSAGQVLAASVADDYVTAVLDAQGIDPTPDGVVVARAFAGVASDGRDLTGLLEQPAIRAKVLLGQGRTVDEALTGGRLLLDMLARTQVADAGRAAEQVAIGARRAVGGYVRMLQLPSCDRCIQLAGRFYRWNAGFNRHPRDDCRHIPASEDTAGDLRTDPRAAFESLTDTQQDAAFGKAGAQAIRDGADMNRVVNARRGMEVAGDRRYTTEATTKRGRVAGQARGPRLTPAQVYTEAGTDRSEAVRLLKANGYLI